MNDFSNLIERLRATAKEHSEIVIFEESASAIERLYKYTIRVCPKCDGCGDLLLEGGIVESDGLHGKLARIVCPVCRAKNPHACDPESVEAGVSTSLQPSRGMLSLQNWKLTEGDTDTVIQALAMKSAVANISAEPLQPYKPKD
jgi:hypothetical protein